MVAASEVEMSGFADLEQLPVRLEQSGDYEFLRRDHSPSARKLIIKKAGRRPRGSCSAVGLLGAGGTGKV
jgi:hypothetical protein